MTRTPRIGLFGGSFDPVHDAHLALARLALDALQLDELRWIPAGQPWQKARAMAPAADRAAMVRLAIEGEARFALAPIELERAGPSYTIDTVRALQAVQPGCTWFLLIGEDQYARFDTWHAWRELLGLVTLAVAGRRPPGASVWPGVAEELRRAPHAVVALPEMPVSSTDIRERLARGIPIDDLVPPKVADYIAAHHLYGPTSAPSDPPRAERANRS